jgi:hypothetical protein
LGGPIYSFTHLLFYALRSALRALPHAIKMNSKNKKSLKTWVDQWKITGPAIDKIRRKEIMTIDTSRAIQNLSDVFESSIKRNPLRHSSGLVEMQSYFRKMRS